MNAQQQFNEALMKLCILLYQSDGKITLSEQDYFDALAAKIRWQGEEDLEDFQSQSIHEVRDVISSHEQVTFINGLKKALSYDARRAFAVAQGIAHIDGEVTDEEQDILDYLENRVLAKELRALNTSANDVTPESASA